MISQKRFIIFLAFLFFIFFYKFLMIKFSGFEKNCINSFSSSTFLFDNKISKLRKAKFEERKRILNDGGRSYEIYNLLASEAFCPNLIRLGRLGDGGKWICNPFVLLNLKHECVMYSLGLNNEISFEMELINLTNYSCKHVAIDIDRQNRFTLKYLNQSKILLGKISAVTKPYTNEISFTDILQRQNTTYIDILKVDIEGSEHNIIDQLVSIPVCQMLIEIHNFHQGKNSSSYDNIYKFLHGVSLKGFYLLHYEINWRTMEASEFTLMHESCFKIYGINTVFGKFLS